MCCRNVDFLCIDICILFVLNEMDRVCYRMFVVSVSILPVSCGTKEILYRIQETNKHAYKRTNKQINIEIYKQTADIGHIFQVVCRFSLVN